MTRTTYRKASIGHKIVRRDRKPWFEPLEQRTLLAYSSLVYPGADGNLIYTPDAQGNRIPDFANVGYRQGLVPLPGTEGVPNVPTRVTLDPAPGDAGARIQVAIDQVSQLPPDANGYRGAILFHAGEYDIQDHIEIRASGVVLRGSGASTAGTIFRATGTSQRTLVQVIGSGSRQRIASTEHNIVDKYVPVGARSFHVDSTAGLNVGDTVVVHRPSTANWIHDIGMDRLTNPWQPNSKNLDSDRIITRIEDNQITIDAPLTNALERTYGGGTIYRYNFPGRIENVGITNIRGVADFRSSTDEAHSWRFISLDAVQNSWVRNIVATSFAFGAVDVGRLAKWVTVDAAQMLDAVSQITGGRRYSFNVSGQLILIKNSVARRGRHDFVLNSIVPGPNAFVDDSSTSAYNEVGPHQRWSTGALFDNVSTHGNSSSGLDIRNALNEGTGHGWQGANMVVWNSTADRMRIYSPPTARNWAIGDTAPSHTGNGYFESFGQPVQPRSLYFQQLGEYLAYPGLDKREYWLGDIDNFTPGDPEDMPYVDPAWYDTVAATTGEPLKGFDDLTGNAWVPFTFQFGLADNEAVVGATLSLALRATASGVTGDQIYLNGFDNGYTYADLGWLPIPQSGSSVRVLDLSGQLDQLQGGQLNVALGDNSAIDWAVLNLEVAPIPQGSAGTGRISRAAVAPSASQNGPAGDAASVLATVRVASRTDYPRIDDDEGSAGEQGPGDPSRAIQDPTMTRVSEAVTGPVALLGNQTRDALAPANHALARIDRQSLDLAFTQAWAPDFPG